MNETTENEVVEVRPDPPGRRLRQAREQKGLSQAEVAKSMRLTVRMVDMLERDDFENLPAATFVKGYLRNYAAQVGLPGSELVDAYCHYLTDAPAQSHSSFHMRDFRQGGPAKGGMLMLLSLAGLLLILFVLYRYWWQGGEQPVPSEPVSPSTVQVPAVDVAPAAPAQLQESVDPDALAAPEEPQRLTEQVLPQAEDDGEAAGATDPAPAAMQVPAPQEEMEPGPEAPATAVVLPPDVTQVQSLVPSGGMDEFLRDYTLAGEALLYFNDDAWVEVHDGKGVRVLYQLCRAGRLYRIHGVQPYRFKLGNASKVDVYFNGSPVDIGAYTERNVARFSLGES